MGEINTNDANAISTVKKKFNTCRYVSGSQRVVTKMSKKKSQSETLSKQSSFLLLQKNNSKNVAYKVKHVFSLNVDCNSQNPFEE